MELLVMLLMKYLKWVAEAYSEPCQTSKEERFAKKS